MEATPWPQSVNDIWDTCLQKSKLSEHQFWKSMLKYYCKLHNNEERCQADIWANLVRYYYKIQHNYDMIANSNVNIFAIIEPCFNKCNISVKEFTNDCLEFANEDNENQRITCDCGTQVCRRNMPVHLKSNKHCRLMINKYRLGLLN